MKILLPQPTSLKQNMQIMREYNSSKRSEFPFDHWRVMYLNHLKA